METKKTDIELFHGWEESMMKKSKKELVQFAYDSIQELHKKRLIIIDLEEELKKLTPPDFYNYDSELPF